MIEQPPKSRRPNKRVKVESKDDVENSAQSERPMEKLTDAELELLIDQGDADAVVELALRLEASESIDQRSVSSVPSASGLSFNIDSLRELRRPHLHQNRMV